MEFLFKSRKLELGNGTLVMGIHNATPDSFSDGGSYPDISSAIAHCLQMIKDGADIIDIGGESTRPKDTSILSTEEELDRILPVITGLKNACPDCIISVDTMKPEVAKEAIMSGADIINDVSGLKYSKDIAKIATETNAGLIIMHMKTDPKTSQYNYSYVNLVKEVSETLAKSAELAESYGVNKNSIILDPGLGEGTFGKSAEQSLELIAKISEIKKLEYPVLLGASRKGFLGKIINEPEPRNRLNANLAVAACAALKKVDIIRVHDVKETCQFLKVFNHLTNIQ
jgi:dihydropteroate synthase